MHWTVVRRSFPGGASRLGSRVFAIESRGGLGPLRPALSATADTEVKGRGDAVVSFVQTRVEGGWVRKGRRERGGEGGGLDRCAYRVRGLSPKPAPKGRRRTNLPYVASKAILWRGRKMAQGQAGEMAGSEARGTQRG